VNLSASTRGTSVPVRFVTALVAAAFLLAASVVGGYADGARAAEPARFDPGYIIGDPLFYASGSMSAGDVQGFLNAQGAGCRVTAGGSPCLKDYRQDTVTRAPDTRCPGGYAGAVAETAAQIVAKVAGACGISPKVLIVMLQKEQGLVTASGTSLTPNRYRSAMGYGCPDTSACDARYYGFFNQVYQAAWQLRSYALTPTRWAHRPGVVNEIRYHPDASCGSAPVLIRNQATASLYNYTPYQPNVAALAAGSGTGDACSAYGNRNFFNYYTAWFGPPNSRAAIGAVDAAVASNGAVTVSGWALDPDTVEPTYAHVYIDGTGFAVLADAPRGDVGAAFGAGDRHGFVGTFPAAPGPHSVCAYAINVGAGANSLAGCRTVTVPDQVPIGAVDAVTASGTAVTVSGWSLDPDTTASTSVHVYVDGVGTALVADRSRPDVAAAFGRGESHGYSHTSTLTPGARTICVYGINTVAGPNTLLGCRTLTVDADRTPIGNVEAVTVAGSQVTVQGWAVDPDTSASTAVHVYIDGAGVAVAADGVRPDVAAAFGLGDRHGFVHTRTLPPGRHEVCTYAINTAPRAHTALGCTAVTTT